jgi:hypothetical protein
MGIDKDYTVEDMQRQSIAKLYDIMAACEKPGYYQMAVEELERRLLADIGTHAARLADSATRVEALTSRLDGSVQSVDGSIQLLAESSNKMERLTKWIMGLTVALFLLTVAQVVVSSVQVALLLKSESRVNMQIPLPATTSPAATPKSQASESTAPAAPRVK